MNKPPSINSPTIWINGQVSYCTHCETDNTEWTHNRAITVDYSTHYLWENTFIFNKISTLCNFQHTLYPSCISTQQSSLFTQSTAMEPRSVEQLKRTSGSAFKMIIHEPQKILIATKINIDKANHYTYTCTIIMFFHAIPGNYVYSCMSKSQ